MQIHIYGSRGSIPSPGAERLRYGGDTSCVKLTLSDGTNLVLDAGTGIRNLPGEAWCEGQHLHILLTHLHLDHIQGLLFFPPLFRPQTRATIWGPAAAGVPLRKRVARYLSAPLTPIDIREVPCTLEFRDCPAEWEIGSARIRAEPVSHRGPTLGFRIEDAGVSLAYIPDHEPALVGPIEELGPAWISGYSLAHDVDLLVHDCQYTDAEYPDHFGWGHSAISHAIDFAHRCGAARTLMFHHDPEHTDDQLDAALLDAQQRWIVFGKDADRISMACDGEELTVTHSVSAAPAV